MKSKYMFTPRKIITLSGIITISLLLSGCSASTDIIQTQESEASALQITETATNPETDHLSSFNSEGDLWDYLESTYPITSVDAVNSGQYANNYVIMDSIVQNVSIDQITSYVKCDMYFTTSTGESHQKYFACFYTEEDLQKYGCISGQQYLSSMQNGDVFRICYYINSDNSFGAMNMLAIKRTANGETPATEAPASNSADSRLKNATVFTADVYNGTGTEIIGQRAYIIFPKDALKEITAEGYSQFLGSTVKDSGYNWFSIICDDGTGINFAGSMSSFATYGEVDSEGCITKPIGYITLSENGYVYENID